MYKRSVKAWNTTGEPHPFEVYLVDGEMHSRRVSKATAKLYVRTLHRLEASGMEPVAWYRAQTRDTQMAAKSLGSVRSAVAHYVVWKDPGQDRAVVLSRLGGTGQGRGEKHKEAMNEDEVELFVGLVQGLPEPLPTFLQMLLFTGLRVSEGCALSADDLMLSGRRPRLEVRAGKGNKPRSVDLSADAVAVLKKYVNESDVLGPGGLFPWSYAKQGGLGGVLSEREVRKLQPYVVRRELQAAREQMEDKSIKDVSPHILRHTLASDMLEAGGTLKHIQVVLGHKGLGVLERYLTIRPEQMRAVIDKMPRRMGGL
jgi:integrase